MRSLSLAGLDVRTFCLTAIDVLERAVPFEAACLGTLDPATHLVTDTVKKALPERGADQEWAHYEYEVEDVAKFVDLAQRDLPVTTVEIETNGDLHRSPRLAEFIGPNWNLSHELRAVAGIDGAMWAGICLFRDETSPGFNAAELEFVGSVAGSLSVGMRMGLLVASATTEVTSPNGPAVLVVGPDDELQQVSAGADARLAELSCSPVDVWSTLPMPLLTLVAAARAHGRGDYPHVPRLRLRAPSGEWLVAHASVLAGRDGDAQSVVLTIEEARPPEIVPLVVAAFGLTPREQAVVRLVLQGIDTAEIARTLHLSTYTVQDHLKSIFAKADVRSRRELTAKVFFDQYAPRMGEGLAPSGWFNGIPTEVPAS